MAREDRLVDTFVTLADTLIDNYDIIDFLQTLAERCVELVDVSAAGIMLADTKGELRHAACSNEQMRFVELLELQFEEGPCLDAYRTHESVVCSPPELLAHRWPLFGPLAAEKGFESVSAVPMRLRDRVIGALNLFSTAPRALGDEDLPRGAGDGRCCDDRDPPGAFAARCTRVLRATRGRARIAGRHRAGEGNHRRAQRHQRRRCLRAHSQLCALSQPPLERDGSRDRERRARTRSAASGRRPDKTSTPHAVNDALIRSRNVCIAPGGKPDERRPSNILDFAALRGVYHSRSIIKMVD